MNHDKGQKFKGLLPRLAYLTTLNAALLKAKKIITVSKSTAKDLHKNYPHTKKKTKTIYLGVDDIFLNFDPESSTPKDLPKLPKNYVLYTGNWRSHKNLPNLIKAFYALKKDYDYKGKLILTGKPDPKYPETLQKIEELGLKEDVILTGLVQDTALPHLYHNADVYIFPSLYEGFGLPILESFATSTPIVVSEIDTLSEIGSNGVLTFNPIDPQDIAHKASLAITDKEKRNEMISAGHQRLKDFSFKNMAEETLKLYKSVL